MLDLPTTAETAGRARVLFVDDELAVLDGIRRALHGELQQWETAFETSPLRAFQQMSDSPVDCLVADVFMSEMNGLDLLRRIKEHERLRHTEVIIVTGAGQGDLKRRALELGAADLLQKPVDQDELLARIRNVLRLKRASDDLRRANLELQGQVLALQRTELIGQLAAGVVHDLRNALGVVTGYSELLHETPLESGERGSAIESVMRASKLAAGIVDQIHRLSRPGRAELIDVTAILSEFAPLLKALLRADIARSVKYPGRSVYVFGTVAAFQQILLNLVVNARQAMAGGGTFSLSLAEEGGYAKLIISDTGTGMSAETQSRIFERGFTTKGGQGGSGLGLYAVNELVQAFRGSISVSSEPGRGTEFTILVPLAVNPPEVKP